MHPKEKLPEQVDVEWVVRCLRSFEKDLGVPVTEADRELVDDAFLDAAIDKLKFIQTK